MNEEPPVWKASDPKASLRLRAEWLNEKARRTFLSDKFHTELFLLFRADGQSGIVQPPPKIDRDVFVGALKDAIRQNDIYGVVHIVEAWSYFRKKEQDHTLTQLMMGEMAVSDLKKGDREETLMVRVESRDGLNHLWLSPIVRKGEEVALAEPMEMSEELSGRFGSLFI